MWEVLRYGQELLIQFCKHISSLIPNTQQADLLIWHPKKNSALKGCFFIKLLGNLGYKNIHSESISWKVIVFCGYPCMESDLVQFTLLPSQAHTQYYLNVIHSSCCQKSTRREYWKCGCVWCIFCGQLSEIHTRSRLVAGG